LEGCKQGRGEGCRGRRGNRGLRQTQYLFQGKKRERREIGVEGGRMEARKEENKQRTSGKEPPVTEEEDGWKEASLAPKS
jgi:hypothetical protein